VYFVFFSSILMLPIPLGSCSMDQVITAILGIPVVGHVRPAGNIRQSSPSTTQGKWLALCLAHDSSSGSGQSLPTGAVLFKQVGMSNRQGPKAYKDLVACGWIVADRFVPQVVLRRDSLPHIPAIKSLLERSESGTGRLEEEFGLMLKPDNRLLLMTLLSLASVEGRVCEVGDRELAGMTGFTLAKLKCQMQRLKHLGLVSGTVPGVTFLGDLGVGKSYIYLNLLHPWWQRLYREWRMIRLPSPVWEPISTAALSVFRSRMNGAQPSDLADVPANHAYSQHVEKYVLNVVLVEASNLLVEQLYERSVQVITAVRPKRAQDLHKVVDAVLGHLAGCFKYEQSYICRPNTVWTLVPPFGCHPLEIDKDKGPLLLTNCAGLLGGLDCDWLNDRSCRAWVQEQIVTASSVAPRKYGSNKKGLSNPINPLFWGINT
jgi:hypothetical protein